MRQKAEAMGANAVVGLRYDEKKQKYRAGTGPKGNAYWKSRVTRVWTGTAVTLARPHEISDAILPDVRRGDRFVIDGSNVMHWSRDEPELRDVLAVIEILRARGARVHVFFDASAGHRLVAGYRGGRDFARALGLRSGEVTVVDQGVVADVPILQRARATGATVVTQDRYRDHSGLTDGVAILSGRIEDGRVILHPHAPLGA
ncbi:NYN domain-containing protein [Wenxinia marina]|nr:hypothetical protein [Wenxinia marina]